MVATRVNVAMDTGDGSKRYNINKFLTGNHNSDVNKAKCANLIDSFSRIIPMVATSVYALMGTLIQHQDVNKSMNSFHPNLTTVHTLLILKAITAVNVMIHR